MIKKILILVLLVMPPSLRAAALEHDAVKLRQLSVFPGLDFNVNFKFDCDGGDWRIGEENEITNDVSAQRELLKKDPGNIQANLHFIFLLGLNDETNEAKLYKERTEVCCRHELEKRRKTGF